MASLGKVNSVNSFLESNASAFLTCKPETIACIIN